MNNVQAQEFMQACVEALECQICYKLPMPGDPKWKDCDFGHAVCANCQSLVEEEEVCSTCRSGTMMDMPDSIPRKKIVEALFRHHRFPCTHAWCVETFEGKDLQQHIQTCRHKVVKCPAPGCNHQNSWNAFIMAPFDPCFLVATALTRQDGWDIVYSFDEILTGEGKTRIMSELIENGSNYFRAFLHFEFNANRDVCFYVTWADQRKNVEAAAAEEQEQRVLMAASLYVPRGHYTEATVSRLNFWGDNYNTGDTTRQLVIGSDRFNTWTRQAQRQNECIKCPATNEYQPHVHINVMFPNDMRV